METFIPWDAVQPYIPFYVAPEYVPHVYGIVFTFFAMFYSILGGMHSIVLGDFRVGLGRVASFFAGSGVLKNGLALTPVKVTP